MSFEIYAMNFSDSSFEKKRQYNSYTAYKIGKVHHVFEFSPDDFDSNFLNANKLILSHKRGCGYWLWKPYFILKALSKIKYGDYLFYCDSGSFFVNEVSSLIPYMDDDIMVFELPLLCSAYTKKETILNMGVDPCDRKQILAGYILLKKSNRTIEFMKEWYNACSNPINILDLKTNKYINEDDDFIEHRHDQSIFSLLCFKYSIKPHRDPSQFGEFYWEYSFGNKSGLVPSSYVIDTYPRLLISNRRSNPWLFYKYIKIKDFLYKAQVYNISNYFRYYWLFSVIERLFLKLSSMI